MQCHTSKHKHAGHFHSDTSDVHRDSWWYCDKEINYAMIYNNLFYFAIGRFR